MTMRRQAVEREGQAWSRREAVEQNGLAWEKVAATHAVDRNLHETRSHLEQDTAYYIDSEFRTELEAIGLHGKVVAQFNCNNGRELISSLQFGAERGYGFDISEGYVEQAKWLAESVSVPAEFLAADIYALPARYDGSADLVFVTAAAMCWMPDLRDYFAVAHRVLRPGGTLLIYETHPFAEMFKPDAHREAGESLVPHYQYGTNEPFVFDSRGDYYGDPEQGIEIAYWFHHSMSKIQQATLDAGFEIRRVAEFDHDVCVGYRDVERIAVRPPLSFMLRCERE